MRYSRIAILAGILSVAAVWVAVPLHAQGYCGDGSFLYRQITCTAGTCHEYFDQIYQPLGQGTYAFIQGYVQCCGEAFGQWFPNGYCLPAAPQRQAALNPPPKRWYLMYVMTCKGSYGLLRLPKA